MDEHVWMMWISSAGQRGGFPLGQQLSEIMENDPRMGERIEIHRDVGSQLSYTLVKARWYDEAERKADAALADERGW